jgi:hypothetical protein
MIMRGAAQQRHAPDAPHGVSHVGCAGARVMPGVMPLKVCDE